MGNKIPMLNCLTISYIFTFKVALGLPIDIRLYRTNLLSRIIILYFLSRTGPLTSKARFSDHNSKILVLRRVNLLCPMFGEWLQPSQKLEGKLLLSILYFNMEVWRLPSNHDQAKDAWPNIMSPTDSEQGYYLDIFFLVPLPIDKYNRQPIRGKKIIRLIQISFSKELSYFFLFKSANIIISIKSTKNIIAQK